MNTGTQWWQKGTSGWGKLNDPCVHKQSTGSENWVHPSIAKLWAKNATTRHPFSDSYLSLCEQSYQ